MKVTETKDEIIYEVMEPSEKAMAVRDAIIDACIEQNVSPAEIYPILSEAIVRLLVISAQTLGYDVESYVHNFGKGLATCEIKFKDKKN
jgi:hypothetical protein